MIAADRPDRRVRAAARPSMRDGRMRHLPRAALAALFSPGDLVVANDAATLPASLHGTHRAERRADRGPARRLASRSATRPASSRSSSAPAIIARAPRTGRSPPPLAPGDRLALGPLRGRRRAPARPSPPGRAALRGRPPATVLAGLARHGRPIQYAHVPEPLALWDVWTRIAADPVAFEPPSAGFALDWRTLARLAPARRRLRHAHPRRRHLLDRRSRARPAAAVRRALSHSRAATAAAIARAKADGGRIVAIGTTVVRALEAAARRRRQRARRRRRRARTHRPRHAGCASSTRSSPACTSPAKATSSCCAPSPTTRRSTAPTAALAAQGYRDHEFGDSMLIERRPREREAAVYRPLRDRCELLS